MSTRKPLAPPDALASARSASLRYVDDAGPGFRRVRHGKGFRYRDAKGAPLVDKAHLERIRHLAIPPAWTEVWICPLANGHIQATGRDARGRKQYRYHARWREVRDETKYGRLVDFARVLPRIRAAVHADMSKPGLSREKILGTVVRLLEVTYIRIGHEEYVRQNGSFGLTTMREDHVDVQGATVRFRFRGKSGIKRAVDVHDRRVARVIMRCQELPGEILFQYVGEDGSPHAVEATDVNAYIRAAAGAEFTAKDFRTWAGTVLAAEALREAASFESVTAANRNIVAAIRAVAKRLGNTPAVCRRCYVHPVVLSSYREGRLLDALGGGAVARAASPHDLSDEEEAVLRLMGAVAPLAKAA